MHKKTKKRFQKLTKLAEDPFEQAKKDGQAIRKITDTKIEELVAGTARRFDGGLEASLLNLEAKTMKNIRDES